MIERILDLYNYWLVIVLMMTVSFIYPASAVLSGGLGLQHLMGVYLGLVMLGIGIASVGLACSAFTGSQIIAAVSTVGVTFILYDFHWSFEFVSEGLAGVLDAISMHPHFGRFSEGLIGLENVTYFLALAIVSAGARLAHHLLRLPAREVGDRIVVTLPLAKKDLASELSITPETTGMS